MAPEDIIVAMFLWFIAGFIAANWKSKFSTDKGFEDFSSMLRYSVVCFVYGGPILSFFWIAICVLLLAWLAVYNFYSSNLLLKWANNETDTLNG